MVLTGGEKSSIISLAILAQLTNVTDSENCHAYHACIESIIPAFYMFIICNM